MTLEGLQVHIVLYIRAKLVTNVVGGIVDAAKWHQLGLVIPILGSVAIYHIQYDLKTPNGAIWDWLIIASSEVQPNYEIKFAHAVAVWFVNN